MNSKLISLFLLTVICVSLASASLSLTTSNTALTIADGQSQTVTITINNSESVAVDSLNLIKTGVPSGWSWTDVSAIPSSLPAGNTTTFTAKLNVPLYASSNSASLNVSGNVGSTPISSSNLVFSVTVPARNALSFTTAPEALTESKNSTTAVLKNTGNTALTGTLSLPNLKDSNNNEIPLFLSASSFTLSPGVETTITISYTDENAAQDFDLGTYSSTLTATSGTAANATTTVSFTGSFCEEGDVGDSDDLKITSIKDQSSEDDWEWRLLDEVDVDVKVQNRLGDDEDITVMIDLYNPETNEFIELDDNEQTISIDDGKSETATFTIKVPADLDFDSSSKTYRLYAKAFIEDSEDEQCTSRIDSKSFQEIIIKKDSRDVAITSIDVPEQVTCGETAQISAKIFNTGRKDEDKVKVNLYNRELGINLDSASFSLDQGDDKTVFFNVVIPANATQKTYTLELYGYYDYDEDDDKYGETSESFKENLKVEGNCVQVSNKAVSIAASLDSEAKAGEQVTIKALIKNTGQATTTYNIFVTGNDAWSSLDQIAPQSLTLDAGKSGEVTILLTPNADASGDQTFKIKVVFDSQTKEQPVSLTLVTKESGAITGSVIGESLRKNWFIWVIVLVNVILIILIIVVAARIARS